MNATRQLRKFGQSLWLDYIRRDLISGGELMKLMAEDGICGMTSNPTIFEKAIAETGLYDEALTKLLRQDPELPAGTLFERLEVADIQAAADVLRPIFDQTNGGDGYVSIEVSPHLAYDTQASIAEAHRLWNEVKRPNLMVKIPATCQGMPAIEQLTADGVNVNITLMFSVAQYEAVAEAYLKGIVRTADPRRVMSVASFFVSRVDTAVDRALEDFGSAEMLALRGKAGIANARLAYRRFREIFDGENFAQMRKQGIRLQRPLWASTSTKNKAYSDVMYVEELIGPDTVNSIPPETLKAFRDHGHPASRLGEGLAEAEDVAGTLEKQEISLTSIGQTLLEEGIEKFSKSFDSLLATLDKKKKAILHGKAA
ncbi:MAG TPA: transaldolase [Terriglobales bacterium]